MLKRTVTLAALVLLAAAPASAAPTGPIPAPLKRLRPHKVVEQVLASQQLLALTPAQFAALDDLAQAIQDETHTWVRVPGKQTMPRHVRMTSQQQAYDQALALLTPEQEVRFAGLYAAPIATERVVLRRDRGTLPGKP